MRMPHVLLVLTAAVCFACRSAVATVETGEAGTLEKPLGSAQKIDETHDVGGKWLRALKRADGGIVEEEKGLFSGATLKKYFPGSVSWKAAQSAKALKSASKQVKYRLLSEWINNPILYDRIAKNDNELFKTFKIWRGLGYSEGVVYQGMKALGKTSGDYLQIFYRYKIYLNDLAPRVRVVNV